MKYGITDSFSQPITEIVEIIGKRNGDYVKVTGGDFRHVGYLVPETMIDEWNAAVAVHQELEQKVIEHTKVFFELRNEITRKGLKP